MRWWPWSAPLAQGKTTLVNLLPRFVQQRRRGAAGRPPRARDWDLTALRAQFALVSQDVVMFNDSIAANVALGRDVDLQRVHECLAAANLSAYVEGLPQRGEHLGRSQRHTALRRPAPALAIARALYKNALILILDEATSALDTESNAWCRTPCNGSWRAAPRW